MQGMGGGSNESTLASIRDALNGVTATGTSLLVLVESMSGLAGEVTDLIPEGFRPPRRAVGAEATQVKVGAIADTLDLGSLSDEAIVVENAQWADPTSMGRLQRLLEEDTAPPLMVIAHVPIAAEDRWWLDQIEAAGAKRGTVLRTTAPAEPPSEPPASDDERDLVLASTLLPVPISVPVAAQLLETDETGALEVAERLVAKGLLTETRSGFRASSAGWSVEAGEARRGRLAGRLADVLEGRADDPAVIGILQLAAADHRSAYPNLLESAKAAQTGGAGGEAYHLASAALSAAAEAGIGTPEKLGELHLICGRFLAAGRSEEAVGHLEQAVALLEGPARIDALGFAASVADNRQLPQVAERLLAIGEWEAATQGELAKLGSLGTFRALELSRIGFAPEADDLLNKAGILLDEHGTEIQRFNSVRNRAWMAFDRGQVTQAETDFTRLRDLTDDSDLAGLADRDAWLARCRFATGHPRLALEAVDSARELATRAQVEAPLFLADLALAEGALAFGRPEEALEAADRVRDIVERQLPSWRNLALFNRASALLQLGQTQEAVQEIEAAIEATPAGADGWRWRSRCRALQIEIGLADGSASKRDAEDLADSMVQAKLFGWAAELKCAIAEHTKDKDAARESMALAVQLGNAMLAARAAQAGNLWKEASAAPVIRSVQAIDTRLPDGWADTWRAIPAVAAALAAPEPTQDEAGRAENQALLEETLARAGLGDKHGVLTPAQRRAAGLVRYSRRPLRPLTMVAAALAVVAVAAGTAFAVSQLTTPEVPEAAAPPVDATVTTPTTLPLSLEETAIEVPVDQLFGTAIFRGDYGRSGYADVSGPRSVDGFYWTFRTAGSIGATPVAYGNNLLVGSSDRTFQAIDLTSGEILWSMATEDEILTPAGLGTADMGESTSALVIVVGDDGNVRARDPLSADVAQAWPPTRLGAPIRSSPVVDGQHAYVATTAGVVYALDLSSGAVVWQYPAADEEPLGAIVADLTLDDGIIYVGTQEGTFHQINTDGSLHCEATKPGPLEVNPVVVDGQVFIVVAGTVEILPVGVCEVLVSDMRQYLNPDGALEVAPAIVGDIMYLPNGDFLLAIDHTMVGEAVSSPDELDHWSAGKVNAGGKIVSPPVVTNDAVYFGTENGLVYAVDADTGDPLWDQPWQADSYVRASPVVLDGVVYIASGDGTVYAVGPEG